MIVGRGHGFEEQGAQAVAFDAGDDFHAAARLRSPRLQCHGTSAMSRCPKPLAQSPVMRDAGRRRKCTQEPQAKLIFDMMHLDADPVG